MHLDKSDANFCGCSCRAFAPVVGYEIKANSIVFTQSSTFDSGDSLKRLRCEILDADGTVNSAMMSGEAPTTAAVVGAVTVASGEVTAVALTSGGAGYTAPPIVELTGGGGTGAVVTATLDAAGTVTGFVIVHAGSGYTSAPTAALATNKAEVSLVGLNRNDTARYSVKAFIVSAGGCKADLKTPNVQATVGVTGNLGNINKQGDNNEDGNN